MADSGASSEAGSSTLGNPILSSPAGGAGAAAAGPSSAALEVEIVAGDGEPQRKYARTQKRAELHPEAKLSDEQRVTMDKLLEQLDQQASVVITNPLAKDNPIVYVTPSWQDMCGFTYSEAVGKNPRLTQGTNTNLETTRAISCSLTAKQPCKVQLINYRSGDAAKPFWNVLSVSPVISRGSLQFFIANLQDYSYQMARFVKLTPSQFCRAAQHFQRGRRLDTLTPFRLAKPAVYEADDEFTLPAPSSASRYQSAVTPHPIKRLGWSSLSLEPEHLSARIEDALQRMDATTEVTERADSEGETFMVHAKLANGTAMRVAVFEDPADGQYRISCTRLSGETFSYHEAFRAMRTHLADAVAPNAAPPPGAAVAPEPTAVAAAAAAAVPTPGPFSLLAASESGADGIRLAPLPLSS